MPDSERLKEVIKHYNMSSNGFGRYLGLDNSQKIYDILKNRNGISRDLAEIIKAKCLDINIGWLLTGEGSMVKNESNPKPIADFSMEKVFEMFQRGEIYSAIAVKEVVKEKDEKIKEKDEKINKLYEEIGDLKAKIKELEKPQGKAIPREQLPLTGSG
jgi:hypothetical protein